MRSPAVATDLAGALCRAIESGDFAAAQPLILEYAKTVRQELSSAETPNQRESIFGAALQTLNQHLHLTRALRSHICARLQAITGQSLYSAPGRQTYTWHMDA